MYRKGEPRDRTAQPYFTTKLKNLAKRALPALNPPMATISVVSIGGRRPNAVSDDVAINVQSNTLKSKTAKSNFA